MQIVVASGNIFRRELSVFVLSEAGYSVVEVTDTAALIALIDVQAPALIVIDASLAGAEPARLAGQIRSHSAAPLLWITSDAAPTLVASATGQSLNWPYHPDDLLSRTRSLAHSRPLPTLQQRYAGGE
jgi:CheY-like chemotaxis protein